MACYSMYIEGSLKKLKVKKEFDIFKFQRGSYDFPC